VVVSGVPVQSAAAVRPPGLPAGPTADGGRPAAPAAPAARAAGWEPFVAGPLSWMVPAIALQAVVSTFAPLRFVAGGLDPAQAVAAAALILGGGGLIRAAARELEDHATPVCTAQSPTALVATGPYRFSRHPMHLGALAVLAGTATALGTPGAAAVALVFAAWVDRRHSLAEDAALHARFGAAWRAYAERTRRWL
jgi:protein-S-isoprenylcysteine O-methyltransferase Ste14